MFGVDLLRCEKLSLWKHYNLDHLKDKLCSGLLGDRGMFKYEIISFTMFLNKKIVINNALRLKKKRPI